MAASEIRTQPAYDKPGHPPDPNKNFLWLYITIFTIFVVSIMVKCFTVIHKKSRDRKRGSDLERQQLEAVFKKWWFPWRYNKKGKSKASSSSGSGTGESCHASSSRSSCPQLPNLPKIPELFETPEVTTPPESLHLDSYLDRLVYRRSAADTIPGSPPLMSGALSPGPESVPSPIQLLPMNSRLDRAGMSDSTGFFLGSPVSVPRPTPSEASGSFNLPVVNPFTSKPFRSGLPRRTDRPEPESWTTPPRSESNASGYGAGNLSPTAVDGPRFDSSSFGGAQFGRSITYQSPYSEQHSPDTSRKSGVPEGDLGHGYGSQPASSSTRSEDRRERDRADSDNRPASKDKRPPPQTPSAREKRDGSLRHRPSDPSSRSSSSRYPPSSSKAPSSRYPPSSSRATPSSSRAPSTQASSSGTPSRAPAAAAREPGKRSAMATSDKFKNARSVETEWNRDFRAAEAEKKKEKEEEEVEKKRQK